MNWPVVWLSLLGCAVVAYLLLEGYVIGMAVAIPAICRDSRDRDAVIAAIGRSFLGNEVLLVVIVGILLGAFPSLEGKIISGCYPVIILLVTAVVVRDASLHLRRRLPRRRWQRGWEVALVASSAVVALAWGAIGSLIYRALPVTSEARLAVGASELFAPFTIVCAVAALLAVTAHGSLYAARALSGPVAERARRISRRLASFGVVAVAVVAATAVVSRPVRVATQQPAVAWAGLAAVGALVGLLIWCLARGALGAALVCSGAALSAVVVLLAAARAPYLLVYLDAAPAGMTLAHASADEQSLRTLSVLLAPVLPVMVAARLWQARVTRPPVPGRISWF
ncbi:MAG TPA: cytochrome d ubiquinol oxidase subunit II [Micromonospora sp.]